MLENCCQLPPLGRQISAVRLPPTSLLVPFYLPRCLLSIGSDSRRQCWKFRSFFFKLSQCCHQSLPWLGHHTPASRSRSATLPFAVAGAFSLGVTSTSWAQVNSIDSVLTLVRFSLVFLVWFSPFPIRFGFVRSVLIRPDLVWYDLVQISLALTRPGWFGLVWLNLARGLFGLGFALFSPVSHLFHVIQFSLCLSCFILSFHDMI